MRYYCTHRPVGPGTVPRGFTNFENYDTRTYASPIDDYAYGWVEYDEPIDYEEYELTPESVKGCLLQGGTAREVDVINNFKAMNALIGAEVGTVLNFTVNGKSYTAWVDDEGALKPNTATMRNRFISVMGDALIFGNELSDVGDVKNLKDALTDGVLTMDD